MEKSMRWNVSLKMIQREFDHLPNLSGIIPEIIRRKSAMLFITSSIWVSAIIFAYIPPIAFLWNLPTEAWGLISAVCGVLGTLITTWVIKRFDARISQRTTESTTQTEMLKSTIDWALKERQELYKESEEAYKRMLDSRDKEIERLTVHLNATLQELELSRKSGPVALEKEQ